MGVPAIVTGWSGTADIVTPDVGWLVNYTLAPVRNGRGKRGGEERAGGGLYFRPADVGCLVKCTVAPVIKAARGGAGESLGLSPPLLPLPLLSWGRGRPACFS